MLNNGKLTVHITELENGTYGISVVNEQQESLITDYIQKLLFTWDETSYHGTRVQTGSIGDTPVFIVDSWGLLNLFAKEGFNSFVEWEWSEMASVCLSAAPILYETVQEGIPIPDFTSLLDDTAAWNLPAEVKLEFDASFWSEKLDDNRHPTVQSFIEQWYNRAINVYLSKYSPMKERWINAVAAINSNQLSPEELQTFFNEKSWQRWLGLQDDPKPFVTGLRLSEPLDGDGPWMLEVTLHSKKDETIIEAYSAKKLPRGWNKYRKEVQDELKNWLKIVPWLGDKGIIKEELTEAEAWDFLTDASEKLIFLGAEILLPSWWIALKDANLKVKAKVKSQSTHSPAYVGLKALMDFDWRISLNGEELSEMEFQNLVDEKRRLIYIRGQWVKLDPSFIKQIQVMMEAANQKGLKLNDFLQQELINDLENEDDEDESDDLLKIQFELNQELKKMIGTLRETRNIPIQEAPATLHGELRPYQALGMSWLLFLRERGFGACLADDMGLGKTVQLIAYLLKVKEMNHMIAETAEEGELPMIGASLIVCPTSVLGNWQKELERFAPSLKVRLHYGSTRAKGEDFAEKMREYDVVLTSFGLTHQDQEEIAAIRWNSIILDEAQNIKNSQTKQSRAVRKFQGLHHIALTGTPMENRLSELWAIFDFINKGYLGSLGQFQERYVSTIEREEQKDKIKELQRLIQPFLLRRTKKDKEVALNLPDKQEQKEFVPLTKEQASLYEQMLKDTFSDIEKLSAFERKGIILQMLNKLKQLCNHPGLYLKEPEIDMSKASQRSGKLEKLTELVDAVQEQGESCLIFTQYLGMGEMIKQLLEKRFGFSIPFLNGSMGKKQRDEMIEQFQAGKFPVFILSLKAGGTGLNLTEANHVIHYDRWWNPAVENQATDRAYRIGQKRFVHVHKLICTGTLEEKIDAMLDKKQALNDEIISSDNWITELSTEELKDLVALT